MHMSNSDMTHSWLDVTRNANDTWPEAYYRGALCYRVVASLLLCSDKVLLSRSCWRSFQWLPQP